MKPWVYKSKSKVKNDMCFLASHCIDTFVRVQLSFRSWAVIQSWHRFKVERDSQIFFRNGSYIGHVNPGHPIHHVRHLEMKNIIFPPWESPPPSNMEIFCLPWISPPASNVEIICPLWTSPPNIQILKYFAHLDHHLEHLAGYSRSSDLSGAVGNLAKESSKSKVENQRQALQTFNFDYISFAHHCDFLRLWKRGGNFGGNLWK